MIQTGLRPTLKDKRDYSFHRTFGPKYGAVMTDPTSLPADFSVDADLWMPDQNAMGLPQGCTGMTQADLMADQDGVIYDPKFIYQQTPPYNLTEPRNLRDSLKVICNKKLSFPFYLNPGSGGARPAYFNVRPAGKIDFFDAVRIALWVNQAEKRSVSVGSAWFQEFERPVNGILPMPPRLVWESGHNWKVSGWKTIDGVPYLCAKTWQGERYGDRGWVYISRGVFNALMSIWGSAAYTVADDDVAIRTVDRSVVDILVEYIRMLWAFGKSFGKNFWPF